MQIQNYINNKEIRHAFEILFESLIMLVCMISYMMADYGHANHAF
jgi:hypothetical protein